MGLLSVFLVALSCGLLSYALASAKGCDAPTWFIVGFLSGPLGLIAAAGLPDVKQRQYLRQMAEHEGAVPVRREYLH